MDNDEVLGHLLAIESEAAALVKDAQLEADRRVTEAEKQMRTAYENRYRAENEKWEAELQRVKEEARQRYNNELEAYREKIAAITVNTDQFSTLLSNLVEGGS